jgi:hypothetical protein
MITDDNQGIHFLVSKAIIFSGERTAQHSPQKMGLETRKEVLNKADGSQVHNNKLMRHT